MTEYSPLTDWVAGKLGVSPSDVTRQVIEQYQLAKFNETFQWALQRSAFYRKLFACCYQGNLESLAGLADFPFTTAKDTGEQSAKLLCVSQSEISHIVTLESSGTSGAPKRIFFTAAEQQATLDFFCAGLRTFADSSDHVLILLPGNRPGSVGDLLKKGATQLGMTACTYGFVENLDHALAVMEKHNTSVIIGLPTQCLALARYGRTIGRNIRLTSALLTADYVPTTIVRELENIWQCQVYEHYGMTEMGLGGAMQCSVQEGYHLREADLYFEIINPETGQVLPYGKQGEVVFTTLTRLGMPLIRYRTGDIARIVEKPCCCGTVLRKLDKVSGRRHDGMCFGSNQYLTMAELDEALFPINNVVDFYAAYQQKMSQLELTITLVVIGDGNGIQSAYRALYGIPVLRQAVKDGTTLLTVKASRTTGEMPCRTGKRIIECKEG